ncbi:M23 family metallopeptidase [Lampropedia puyangensis]|uniref:M23 family metallopeptidase n=1 Tax=Lampropedia puyangensis TaxID=1330072 RepID=A0A4S8EWH9_9BURK|nr:M23 family metallopeptidase [Lampropedia puyangensis]THT98660.1 M23 family metallopeptidase [Lampropedia puyangensis]
MQLIMTDARWSRSYTLNFPLAALVLALVFTLCAGAAALLMLQAQSRVSDWNVQTSAMSRVLGLANRASESLETERAVMRQSMDEMARKVGEMQARLVQLQTQSERVSDLAGVPAPADGALDVLSLDAGGPLVNDVPMERQELLDLLARMDRQLTDQSDYLMVAQTHLYADVLARRMIPTQEPVPGRQVGSAFGTRIDPLTGRKARHTGLDFQAPTGTPILAAAGGIVITQQYHSAYGNMLEIDHGNGVISRYAHASKLLAQRGDVVRRGEKVAEVGSTGRSTGPHLHFEVLVNGQQQNPQRFLAAGKKASWSDLLAQHQQ